MGAPAVSLAREVPEGMDVAEVLTAVSVDYDGCLQRWWIRVVPEKEFLPVTAERDFYEMCHVGNLAV